MSAHDGARIDALVSIAACRALVATASVTCAGDTAVMMSALVGAIVVVAASKPHTAELIASAIAGLEDACGPVAASVRAVVADAGGKPS